LESSFKIQPNINTKRNKFDNFFKKKTKKKDKRKGKPMKHTVLYLNFPLIFLTTSIRNRLLEGLRGLDNGSRSPFSVVLDDPVFEIRPAGVNDPFIGSEMDVSALFALKIYEELEKTRAGTPTLLGRQGACA
jgi:hypothetical protein